MSRAGGSFFEGTGMSEERNEAVRTAAERVVQLEEEVEASGVAVTDGDPLEHARAALHKWIDGMTGVVVSPGLGRVTVIHGDGRRSSIASADLPFLLSRPVGRKTDS
jgi:hypothetical protein